MNKSATVSCLNLPFVVECRVLSAECRYAQVRRGEEYAALLQDAGVAKLQWVKLLGNREYANQGPSSTSRTVFLYAVYTKHNEQVGVVREPRRSDPHDGGPGDRLLLLPQLPAGVSQALRVCR